MSRATGRHLGARAHDDRNARPLGGSRGHRHRAAAEVERFARPRLPTGDACVYELEAQVEDAGEYRLGAIDHATLDADGRVTRFAVYTK
jgi:hypothetical protein